MVTLPEVLSACPQDLDTKLTVQMNNVSSFFFVHYSFNVFGKTLEPYYSQIVVKFDPREPPKTSQTSCLLGNLLYPVPAFLSKSTTKTMDIITSG